MFYRIILDCRPTLASAAQPFVTAKFVEADSQNAATRIAVARTQALMKEKGFKAEEITSFQFTAEEVELIDRHDAEPDAESSFVYYSDD